MDFDFRGALALGSEQGSSAVNNGHEPEDERDQATQLRKPFICGWGAKFVERSCSKKFQRPSAVESSVLVKLAKSNKSQLCF